MKVFYPSSKNTQDMIPSCGKATLETKETQGCFGEGGTGKATMHFCWLLKKSASGYTGHCSIYFGNNCEGVHIHQTAGGYGYDKLSQAMALCAREALVMFRKQCKWSYGIHDTDQPRDTSIPPNMVKALECLSHLGGCGLESIKDLTPVRDKKRPKAKWSSWFTL